MNRENVLDHLLEPRTECTLAGHLAGLGLLSNSTHSFGKC